MISTAAFWEQIGHLVLNSLNEAYSKGEFMLAQNRGVIRLLPKPNKKKRTFIKVRELETDIIVKRRLQNRIKSTSHAIRKRKFFQR